MADNYLESKYEEYRARREAQAKKGGKKSFSLRHSAVNDKRRSQMKEEYGD